MEFSKRQLIGFVGCAVLFVGVFLPIISLPIIGSVNYFQNGRGFGAVVVILAALSAVFLFLKKYEALWLTGAGTLGVLLFSFLGFRFRTSQMQIEMGRNLAGNPFAGVTQLAMQSVQMQWGWAVLVLGGFAVVAAAALEPDELKRLHLQEKLVALAGVLIVVACLAYYES